MIYDCFAFFNELDLLEIRLNELNNIVDKFVIVEATRTFQKKDKPLYFELNKERYKEFLPKIEHIVVDKYPNFFSKFRVPTPWDYDNWQKEFILKGLKNAAPDDVIIISDLDEIPNKKLVLEHMHLNGFKVFEQKFYYYYLNCLAKTSSGEPELWRGSVMTHKKNITTIKKARVIRGKEGSNIHIIKNGGWHFSYLGGIDKIITKIESIAHSEFNLKEFKDPQRIKTIIENGKDLFNRDVHYDVMELDPTFPNYIIHNQNKYEKLIFHK